MKSGIWFGVGVLVTLVVVGTVLVGGWAVWRLRGSPMSVLASRGGMGTTWRSAPCGDVAGPGTGNAWGEMQGGSATTCPMDGAEDARAGQDLSLAQAQGTFESYLSDIGYGHLHITEVMEFERNFYAIAEEPDTDMGAMELLMDGPSGAVSPEIGPNRMWNTKYGMHGSDGMMGDQPTADNTISAEEALTIAQQWLDTHRRGETVEDADPFYGYYTIHTEQNGTMVGMLSVHGTTGQVWYHTWHGDFIRMTE